MTPTLNFGPVANAEELQRLGEISSQCFNSPISDWTSYVDNVGQENFRVIRRAREVVGGLAILPMGQWFGTQCVPMAGIASVGVAPEQRGTGAAVELLTQLLKELHAQGVALSTLYAATQRPYQKVGYEQAGTSCHWELPTQSIRLPSMQAIRDLPMRSVTPLSDDVFHELHSLWARQNNGNLARNQAMWQQPIQSKKQQYYGYLVGFETQPEGYIIFSQRQEARESQLWIWDRVALTSRAGRRLWLFLADHRSVIDKVMWRGPVFDPLLMLLSEQTDQVRHLSRWLLRVVDVPKALATRGYPAEVTAELHLDVQDDLLAENNGRFVLTVSKGRGEVTKGGSGELQLNIRGLAPLYTGLFTPQQLQRTGQIQASETALNVATGLFAGPEPWMPDGF